MNKHPKDLALVVENCVLFNDVFHLEELQRLQDLFSETTGVASILLDTDGNPMTTPSNFCRLCNEFLCKSKKGVGLCFQSGDFMHAETHITVGGKHLANWLIGQVRREETDEKWIIEFTDQTMADRDQLMEAWKEVPVMTVKQFMKVAEMFSAFANEISEKAFSQYLLKEQIAKREKTDWLLQQNEDRFQMLFDQAPLGYQSLDYDGCFLEVNEQWLNTLGYSREEVLGKWFGDFLSPTYTEGFRKRFPLFKAQGKIHSEFEMVHKDGHLLFIAFDGKIGYDANGDFKQTHCILQDITEKKQSEKQIQLLSKATEQSPVTVVITEKDGKINYVNTKFVELTGYSFEEVKGKNPRILQSGLQSKEFYQEFWKTILSGRDWKGEFHNKKKNGELYWESAVVTSILDSQGEISAFIAVNEDVTEKKKNIQDLIIAKEKAEESDRLKTAFLANVSHEIRTPMNGILGFAELLKQPELTGDQQKGYIHIIEKSGARMLNIINDIIDISKIESGQYEVTISETNINQLVDYIFNFFKPEVEKKGLSFLVSNALPNNECIVFSDSEKIYAILINLVKNAIKFTETGYIDIGYKLKPLDTQQTDALNLVEPSVLEFYVKDSGMGIPQEQLDLIFERFRQGSEQLNRKYEGAGLGLSISKAFVEMLGGGNLGGKCTK